MTDDEMKAWVESTHATSLAIFQANGALPGSPVLILHGKLDGQPIDLLINYGQFSSKEQGSASARMIAALIRATALSFTSDTWIASVENKDLAAFRASGVQPRDVPGRTEALLTYGQRRTDPLPVYGKLTHYGRDADGQPIDYRHEDVPPGGMHANITDGILDYPDVPTSTREPLLNAMRPFFKAVQVTLH